MRFGIGGVFARCSACQGEDFYPAFPLTPDRRHVVVCAKCNNQSVYAELIRTTRECIARAETSRTAEASGETTPPGKNRPPSGT
jgi:hypothetical protein